MSQQSERKLAAPEPNPETAPFWEAAADGRLLLRSCKSCGDAHYYPRTICPYCGSSDTDWLEASGKGEIYSVSVMRRGAGAPYAVAWVVLDEGPAMLTNITDCDLDGLAIGQRVELVFKPTGEDSPPVPMFTRGGQ